MFWEFNLINKGFFQKEHFELIPQFSLITGRESIEIVLKLSPYKWDPIDRNVQKIESQNWDDLYTYARLSIQVL